MCYARAYINSQLKPLILIDKNKWLYPFANDSVLILDSVASTLFVLFLLTIIFILFTVYENGKYNRIVFVAIIFRLLVLAAQEITHVFGTADLSDYLIYHNLFIEAIRSGSPISFIDINAPFYSFLFAGWLYYIFDQVWVLRFANVIISVLIIFPLNSINKSVFSQSLKLWQVAIILFWPTLIRYSVMIGRDVSAVFFVLSSVAIILRWTETPSIRWSGLLIIVSVIVFMIRIHFAAYPLIFFSLVYVFGKMESSQSQYDSAIFTAFIGLLMITFYFVHQNFAPSYHQISSMNDLTDLARSRAVGDSVYLTDIYPDSYLDFLWYLPLHAFYFLFSPMPWDIHNIQALATSILTIFVFVMVAVSIWKKRTIILQNWRLLAVLGTIILTAIAFGAVTKNAGGAVRWRMASIMLLLIIGTTLVVDSTNHSASQL